MRGGFKFKIACIFILIKLDREKPTYQSSLEKKSSRTKGRRVLLLLFPSRKTDAPHAQYTYIFRPHIIQTHSRMKDS